MTQVSKRFIKKEIEEKINNLLLESTTFCSSKDLVNEFYSDLLTPTERIMLSKRLSIAYLLLKGQPYSVIRSILKVSSPTIGNVSLMLKTRGDGIRKALKKVTQKEQWRNFFHELGDIAIEILGSGKGSDWKTTKSYLYQRKLAKQAPL